MDRNVSTREWSGTTEAERIEPTDADRAAWSDVAALVRRIQSGDPDAETAFVDRYRRGVSIIIARTGNVRTPVEDLCQDVLAAALEKVRAGAVRQPERLSGFVAGMARVLAIEYFRKESSRRAIEARVPLRPHAVEPIVVDQLLQQERATIVRAVLAELDSERDREILFRFYIAEDDKDQICQDLGLTALHFNRVLFRARERYRAIYREWVGARGLQNTAG